MSYKNIFKRRKSVTQRLFWSILPPAIWDFFHLFTKIMFSNVLIFSNLIDKNMDLSGFNLHFFYYKWDWVSFHMLESHLYFFFSVLQVYLLSTFLFWVLVFCLLIPGSSSCNRKIGHYELTFRYFSQFILMVNTFYLNNFFIL